MSWVAIAVAAVSGVSSVVASQQQAQALKLQSKQATLNAEAESLEGRRQALAIEDQLAQDLASQNALFAARGSLQGEGSAEAAKNEAEQNASRDIDLALFNADIASLNAQQRASNLKADASAAKTQGYFSAAESVVGAYGTYKSSAATKVPIPQRKPSLVGAS